MNGKRCTHPSAGMRTGVAPALAEACFIPRRYEPNYSYPLLVLFHGRGEDESRMLRRMPRISWRNHIALGLRGPELVQRAGRPVGYGWGQPFARSSGRLAPEFPPTTETSTLTFGSDLELSDPANQGFETIESSLFGTIAHLRRGLNCDPARIYLIGVGEGAAVSARLALTYPDRFAGFVSINGWIPDGFLPLGRFRELRQLRALVHHGRANRHVPLEGSLRWAQLLHDAGLDVRHVADDGDHRLHHAMLQDIDRWILEAP